MWTLCKETLYIIQDDDSNISHLKAIIPDVAPDVDGMLMILLGSMLRLVVTIKLCNEP